MRTGGTGPLAAGAPFADAIAAGYGDVRPRRGPGALVDRRAAGPIPGAEDSLPGLGASAPGTDALSAAAGTAGTWLAGAAVPYTTMLPNGSSTAKTRPRSRIRITQKA